MPGSSDLPFSDPKAVANYVEQTPRKVPGLFDLHRMAHVLLTERLGREARLLVLGAGGGMELRALAAAEPDWRFTGVDPSEAMLAIAAQLTESHRDRIDLVPGYIEDAPAGPFDGALCLLTLHFLEAGERLRTLRQIARRLRPDAPFIVAHHSPPDRDDAARWFARSAAFARADPRDPEAQASAQQMAERLPFLTAAEDEALLGEAGFHAIELFYTALSFRGWHGLAPGPLNPITE
ncbi:class I SAM-dependent methyltransferase [Stakelama pacifica]|uniref:tRNA (Cmo5U34)-methyltransferase n=1 Tax=Stakelama pacifica TaxID=517720 RepID=A0A4R6FWD2_9SPHN|nr:class I SAM-dependent methyltransferase [Stakelama pacifica]TDN85610.1 tRNA (cmo5U34)-methyltransferase [Stakelama pacifica]GGO92142.1 methyltransferase [Stakelama pacifica]